MAAPIPLLVLGVPVDLVVADGQDRLHRELSARWRLCLRPPRAADASDRPDRAPRVVPVADRAGAGLAETMVQTTHAVTREAIEGRVGELLMLHAAGLAHPVSGAAVALVAPAGTGKTTVARTLGPGRRYLSDETVGITETLAVVPYPKPLSVRRHDGETKDEVDPVSVGLSADGAPARLAGVAILDRDVRHRGDPEIVELDLFDAILALCPESSSLARLSAPLHRIERLVEQTRPIARLRYAEAGSLEPWLAGLIGPPRGGPEGTAR